MNKSTQKGFAPVVIALVIAILALLGGTAYFSQKSASNQAVEKKGEVMMKKDDAMMKSDEMMDKAMDQMIYNFAAQNNSGETGTVTFSEASETTTKVTIALKGAPKDVPQPAHIHASSCNPLKATPSHSLTSVVNGKSETILNISLENLWKEIPFAVNVHKSGAEAKIYTACADITSDHMMPTQGKEKSDTVMKKDAGTMMAKYMVTVLAGKTAPLLTYNKADYDAAIASNKLVVLYFYANWCPICKEETANALFPAFNELTTDKVIGFRINYKDSDTDKDEESLAREYGIPYQHTKVFVKNGKQILKAPDGWDKARYLTEINKALAQ